MVSEKIRSHNVSSNAISPDELSAELLHLIPSRLMNSPIASGMKIIVSQEENGFSLQDIEVNKKKTDKDKEYSILLTDTTMSVLKKINPECEIRQLKDTTLSSAWTAAMANGQQPSAPEDYIEVEK